MGRMRVTACLLALAMATCLLPETALATSVTDVFSVSGKAVVIAIATIVIIVSSLFATLFAVLIGQLMGSGFILDSGMGEILHLTWIVVRDITNYALLIVLLGAAVVIVLNLGDEQGGISFAKKIIPKFIIALIAINLTFYGAKLVLSVNDVLATAVFALPQAVWHGEIRGPPCPLAQATVGPGARPHTPDCLREITDGLRDAQSNVDTDAVANALGTGGGAAAPAAGTGIDTAPASSFEAVGEFIDTIYATPDSWATSAIDRENFALAMLSNMLDLKKIIRLSATTETFFGTLVATLGAMITTLLTAFIFFFLFIALVIRMIILWVLIAISPLAVAAKIFEDVIKIPLLSETDFMKHFFSAAFFPLLVAFPLSIGMIMIFAGNALTTIGTTSSDAITAALSGDVYALLWWIAAIGVIWVGTRKVMESATPLAAELTKSVYDGVNGFGKGAIGALKYAPVFPIPTGKGLGLSFNAIKEIPAGFRGTLGAKTGQTGRDIGGAAAHLLRPDLTEAKDLGKTIGEDLVSTVNAENFTDKTPQILKSWAKKTGVTRDTALSPETVSHLRSVSGVDLKDESYTLGDLVEHEAFRAKLGVSEAQSIEEILTAKSEGGQTQSGAGTAEKTGAGGASSTGTTGAKVDVSVVVQSLQGETDYKKFAEGLEKLEGVEVGDEKKRELKESLEVIRDGIEDESKSQRWEQLIQKVQGL